MGGVVAGLANPEMDERRTQMSEPAEKLDYGRPGYENGFAAKTAGWLGERVNGVAEFFGMLIAMFGITGGQLAMAFGLGFLAAGFGLTMLGSFRGIFWMFLGAFLIGLNVPVSRR